MAHRMHVGDHLGPGVAQRRPGVPGLGEEAQIFNTVNARSRPLPKHGWRDQFVLARGKPCQQPVGALGLLGRAHDHAADEKELRIVAAVQFAVDGFNWRLPWPKEKSWRARRYEREMQTLSFAFGEGKGDLRDLRKNVALKLVAQTRHDQNPQRPVFSGPLIAADGPGPRQEDCSL